MSNTVEALCWNPLEWFCFFDKEENVYVDLRDNSTFKISSGGSISFSNLIVPRINYDIDKNYPIEIINKDCIKFLTPNITDILKSVSLDKLSKISLNQMKYINEDSKVTYIDLRKNHTVCHNRTIGFSAKYGFSSTTINITSAETWRKNQTIFNTTHNWLEVNGSFANGTSYSPVNCNITTQRFYTHLNWSNNNQSESIKLSDNGNNFANGTCIQAKFLHNRTGNSVAGQVRTNNMSLENITFWLGFDDSSSSMIVNDYIGGLTPTLNGDAKINKSSYFEQGITFDGDNDYVEIPVNPRFNNWDEFVISMWINVPTTNIANLFERDFGAFYIRTSNTDPQKIITLFNGDGTDCFLNGFEAGTITFPLHTWTYIAWMKNATECAVFINGVSGGHEPSTGKITSSSDMVLGASQVVTNDFQGQIDDFMIINGSLQTSDIFDIFKGRFNWTSFSTPKQDATPAENHTVQNMTIGFIDVPTVVAEAPPADTCSCPSSGDWNVDCSDNCQITVECDLKENNLNLEGSGNFTIDADILNIKNLTFRDTCDIIKGTGNLTFVEN